MTTGIATVRRLLIGVTIAGAVIVATVSVDARLTHKDGIGEDVGTMRTVQCPAQSYLVSLKTTVNFWLDFVQIYCAEAAENGDWASTAKAPSRSFILRGWGFDPNQLDIITANTHMLDCPLDSYVTGFDPGVATVTKHEDGRNVVNSLPWHTMIVCRNRRTAEVTPKRYTPIQWGSDPTVVGRLLGWDGMTGARSCKADEVGVGVWARVSDNIRKFGLLCETFARVVPNRMKAKATMSTKVPASALATRPADPPFPLALVPLNGKVPFNRGVAIVGK